MGFLLYLWMEMFGHSCPVKKEVQRDLLRVLPTFRACTRYQSGIMHFPEFQIIFVQLFTSPFEDNNLRTRVKFRGTCLMYVEIAGLDTMSCAMQWLLLAKIRLGLNFKTMYCAASLLSRGRELDPLGTDVPQHSHTGDGRLSKRCNWCILPARIGTKID